MLNTQVVGVVGAGVMGIGVAQNLAELGHQVILLDVSEKILEHSRQEIWKGIRLHNLFKKEESRNNPDEVLQRIRFSINYDELAEVDFIIENVPERWEIKTEVYERIDVICLSSCIFAANTSAISITRIASITKRASKVIGVHFMNPVPIKPMVEVILGYHTSDETVEKIKGLLLSMGKEYIIINDSPGFISNRILMLAINEAIFLLQEQVTSVDAIDNIFKKCFGHKMGPLETADLIGLDTVLFSIETLYESFNDSKYRPCPLLKKMVSAGLYGCKSGRGFYNYMR